MFQGPQMPGVHKKTSQVPSTAGLSPLSLPPPLQPTDQPLYSQQGLEMSPRPLLHMSTRVHGEAFF